MSKKKKSQKIKNANKKKNTKKISKTATQKKKATSSNISNTKLKKKSDLEKEKNKKTVKQQKSQKKEPPNKKKHNVSTKKEMNPKKETTLKKVEKSKVTSTRKKENISRNQISKKDLFKKNFYDKKSKFFLYIAIFILLLSITGILFSTAHILKWDKENKETKQQTEEIKKVITKPKEKQEVEENEKEEIKEEENQEKKDPYWDYTKMNIRDIDFQSLKKINNQTVGWIQVNGTNINYPFVQTTDNDYYLTHSFYKTKNSAGWVFMDYRNDISNFNKNTILYAHGRLDNTMFGSLRNILTNNWINNSNNYMIQLSTEFENTVWQVFSVYQIPTTNDYLQVRFSNAEAFLKFTEKLISRSDYNFNTTVEKSDKILTLSTCYDDTDKMVLHAKLIKREAK